MTVALYSHFSRIITNTSSLSSRILRIR